MSKGSHHRQRRKKDVPSIKQLTQDPWSEVAAKFKVELDTVWREVKTPPYMACGIRKWNSGMVHISDLHGRRDTYPSEFTKVGKTIDVSILEVDEENRKLSLGHKLEENPWDTFENVFCWFLS